MSIAVLYEVTCTKQYTTWVGADSPEEAEAHARRFMSDPEHWDAQVVPIKPKTGG